MLTLRRAHFSTLPALALGLCGAFMPAQMPHPEQIPHKRPSERPSKATPRPDFGSGHFDTVVRPKGTNTWAAKPGENLDAGRFVALKDRNSLAAHPPIHLEWTGGRDAVKGFNYKAWEQPIGTGRQPRLLGMKDLNALFDSGSPVVNSGDVPHGPLWHEFTATHTDKIVIHEKTSANKELQEVNEATELGARTLNPQVTKVFNALPQETNHQASQLERARMGGIVGTRDAWLDVNTKIKDASAGFQAQVASKKALLDELQFGSASVVVVYAHFDGERLYMPGVQGGTISVDEIAKIDRRNQPAVRDRVIVLAACSTAAASASSHSQSLVQVLLQKGIARTVFATDRPFDARSIPTLMANLKSKPLREAARELQQHVELEQPQEFLMQLLKDLNEGEVRSGE